MDKERPILDGEIIKCQSANEMLSTLGRTGLNKILTRNRANRSLFKKFLEAVFSSHGYSFMGLLESTDQLGSRRLAFHLLEKPEGQTSGESLVDTFDPLADAVEPKLILDLYFMDGNKYSPDQAWELLRQKHLTETRPPK